MRRSRAPEPGLFRLLLLQARLIDQKKRRAINLKKRKGTEVYLLGGGEVEGLWVSKKSKNNNIKKKLNCLSSH